MHFNDFVAVHHYKYCVIYITVVIQMLTIQIVKIIS